MTDGERCIQIDHAFGRCAVVAWRVVVCTQRHLVSSPSSSTSTRMPPQALVVNTSIHLQPTTRLIHDDRRDLRGIEIGFEIDDDHCRSDCVHDLVDREPMLEG